MAEKLSIERYKLTHGKQHCDIFLDDLDIATVYEEEYLHLLAAAPLMLEALETVYPHLVELDDMPDVYSSGRVNQDIVEQLKAAIAAAKGE